MRKIWKERWNEGKKIERKKESKRRDAERKENRENCPKEKEGI